eukprot:CAMPEP_0174236740 /NCGR_PEP_ID=MMETSP0417-20130205/5774_1 /TAXON_ID=242541 /ORGANISM="Mayorella sp, Strain BSH-02190019" /LENGTH=1527 /DNA_ID=CAMNT_0015315423 /DNA_START=44 /DNA_END=4627 /DNA_ORIENTATION=-
MSHTGRFTAEDESLLALKLQEVERLKDLLNSKQGEVSLLQRKQKKAQRRAIPSIFNQHIAIRPERRATTSSSSSAERNDLGLDESKLFFISDVEARFVKRRQDVISKFDDVPNGVKEITEDDLMGVSSIMDRLNRRPPKGTSMARLGEFSSTNVATRESPNQETNSDSEDDDPAEDLADGFQVETKDDPLGAYSPYDPLVKKQKKQAEPKKPRRLEKCETTVHKRSFLNRSSRTRLELERISSTLPSVMPPPPPPSSEPKRNTTPVRDQDEASSKCSSARLTSDSCESVGESSSESSHGSYLESVDLSQTVQWTRTQQKKHSSSKETPKESSRRDKTRKKSHKHEKGNKSRHRRKSSNASEPDSLPGSPLPGEGYLVPPSLSTNSNSSGTSKNSETQSLVSGYATTPPIVQNTSAYEADFQLPQSQFVGYVGANTTSGGTTTTSGGQVSSDDEPSESPSFHGSDSDSSNSDWEIKDWEHGDEDEDESSDEENTGGSDWNLRFQRLITDLRSQDYYTPIEDRIRTNMALLHLSQDFIHAAKTYGKIIISEVCVKASKKTIKPVSLGGQAGGDKYIVQGILFKFAVDSHGLFGGNHHAAWKVAGHELKGNIAYYGLHMKELNNPMMALVDYRGFRLIAMSVLPLSKGTLIYGSNDAGRTVHNDNKTFRRLMKKAGQRLNLKPHWCGATKECRKRLWAAADVEGHLGDDKKFYVLDFSRTLPPAFPDPNCYNGHLFQLLRKEFVSTYPKPLCSDAISGFIVTDSKSEIHNAEVREATDHLLNVVIPKFTSELKFSMLEAQSNNLLGSLNLAEQLHRSGINMRYIGLVYSIFLKRFQDQAQLAGLLLVEACARVVKKLLNDQLRVKMKELKLPSEVPYRRLTVEFLNLVFRNTEDSVHFWQTVITPELNRSYNFSFDLEYDDVHSMASFELSDSEERESSGSKFSGKWMLFNRVRVMAGLHFSDAVVARFEGRSRWNPREPIAFLDLEVLGDRVKHMDFIDDAEGSFFQYKGLQDDDPVFKQDMFVKAIDKYQLALSSAPNDKNTLINCATTYLKLLETQARMKMKSSSQFVVLDPQDPLTMKVDQYFLRARDEDQKDPRTLTLYADFLVRCERYERAEDIYLRAIETDPSYRFASLSYGLFLLLRKKETEAKPYLLHGTSRDKKSRRSAIDPVTGHEPMSNVRVYLEDGTFKTIPLHCSSTVLEVKELMIKAMQGRMGAKSNYTRSQLEELRKKHIRFGVQDVSDDSKTEHEFLAPLFRPWIMVAHPYRTPKFLFRDGDPSALSYELSSEMELSSLATSSSSWNGILLMLEKLQGLEPFVDETPASLSSLLEPYFAELEQVINAYLGGVNPQSRRFRRMLASKHSRANQVKWLTANVIHLFRVTSLFFATIKDQCTSNTCPKMDGSAEIQYKWSVGGGNAHSMPASEYIEKLGRWFLNHITHPDLFDFDQYTTSSSRKRITSILQMLYKRVFRVYAHIYYHHWTRIKAFSVTDHFTACCNYHYFFGIENHLLHPKHDLSTISPIQSLLRQ